MPPIYLLTDFLGPGDFFHLTSSTFEPGQDVSIHGHDFAEIFWVTGNPCLHVLNGRTHELQPGELGVIRPGDEHTLQPIQGRWTIHNVAFPGGVLRTLAARHAAARRVFGLGRGNSLPTRLSPLQLDHATACYDRVLMMPRQRLELEWLLLNLLLELVPAAPVSIPAEAPAWLRRACQMIAQPEHLAQGPQGMARLAGRSLEHLARSMREWLGQTPGQYITTLRMHYAAQQLRASNRPIKVIASECGLSNLSHFYSMFKAVHGETPAAWRRQHASPLD